MPTRNFALIVGILFLIAGILGFIPAFTSPPHGTDPDLLIDAGHARLFGLFPVNALHNIVHIAIGIWGIYAARTFLKARTFARGLTVIYGLLAVIGMLPGLSTAFGLVPLFGHDIWLHAGTALVAAYFGFVRHEVPAGTFRVPVRGADQPMRAATV